MDVLTIILERRKNRGKRSKFPIQSFLTKWNSAEDLLKHVNNTKIHSKTLVHEARKQYVISLVTALEVFLKDSCIELINKYKLDYQPLAKKKNKNFNLMEIEHIIKNKISIGEIISEYCNFQNLDDIQETFSLLLGFNFFDELKKYKFSFGEGTEDFIQVSPDFYQFVGKLIKLRHNFVHDINFKEFLSMHQINKYSTELNIFANMISFFLEDLITKEIKWPNRSL